MRTTLSSGAWIEHRAIGDLKRKDKQRLSRLTTGKLMGSGIDPAAFDATDERTLIASVLSSATSRMDVMGFTADQEDAVWALLITGWSYELPVPSVIVTEDGAPVIENAASLGEVPLGDAEEIDQVFAPYRAKLSRRPDPKGTTTSSSNGLSPANVAPPSQTA